MEEVGNHQEASGLVNQFRVPLTRRQQLIQGVEGHELQTGRGKDLGTRHAGKGFLHHAIGAGVPIIPRLPQQFVVVVHQDEVNAPGIHADGHRRTARLRCGFAKSVLNLRPEPDQIPPQRPAQIHGAVGKPVKLLQRDL